MAVVLYHLTERKRDLKELSEKLIMVSTPEQTAKIADDLVAEGLIIKEVDCFKINLGELLSGKLKKN